MRAADGILTARGGMTSHAALVARGWGKCCIVGCDAVKIGKDTASVSTDPFGKKHVNVVENNVVVIAGKTYHEGDQKVGYMTRKSR